MLSGYATGGQLGLPWQPPWSELPALLWSCQADRRLQGALGLASSGCLLCSSSAALRPTHHLHAIFCSGAAAWLAPELPYVHRTGPRLRGLAQLILVAVPVASR